MQKLKQLAHIIKTSFVSFYLDFHFIFLPEKQKNNDFNKDNLTSGSDNAKK